MATIDSKKLLPPSKSSGSSLATQKFLVPVANIKPKSSAIIRASDITPTKQVGEGEQKSDSQIVKIHKNVIQIEKIIGSNNTLLKKIEDNKRKELQKEKFEKREKKLEEKKGISFPDLKSPSLPKLGFLDAIKRFLFYTLLGAAFVKFGKYIPKILEFSKKLIPAIKFLEDFSGNLLNGVVDFVGAGYKAYDKVKEITKQVGGEDLEKKFDEFSKQFNTFANLALIAGMSTMGGSDFSGGKGKPSTTKPGFDRVKGGRVDKPTQARYLSRYGKGAFTNRFGQQSLKGLTGKGAGRLVGKALGRVPIIGGLIDFIISTVIFKEKPGRAAAKAVGATIGSALGTFIPVPFAGTILGGVVGDLVGGALYDSLVGNDKIKAKAQGGQVTRGGQKVSGPSRKIRRVVSKPPKIRPQKTTPGKDVGGRKEIEKLFPSSINPNQRNPLGVLETTSENLKKIPLLGGVMGASLDLAMGQKPDPNVFKRIGYGFGWLIQNAINAETVASIGNVQKEIVGLAGGGAVPRTLSTGENIGMKIGESIAKTLEAMVNSKVTETLQAIRQQFGKEGFGLDSGIDGPVTGEVAAGTVAPGQLSIEQLVGLAKGAGFSDNDAVIMAAIAMAESGGNSNAHNNNRATGDNSYGLWQINMIDELGPARRKQFGISNDEQLKDPVTNAHAARIVKQESGFVSWTVYKNGRYKNFLGSAQKAAGAPKITVYKQPTTGGFVPLGNELGSLQDAKRIAESLGVPLYSHMRPGDPGYHGSGRAMDFSNDAVGKGTPEQLRLAQTLVQKYGKTAKEIFYTPLGFSIKDGKKVSPIDPANHYHHVHVAFEKGGKVHGLTKAILGEKGPEFVLDANTTAALEQNYPGFLDALNKADYKESLKVLSDYASYYNPKSTSTIMLQKVIVEKPVPVPTGGGMMMSLGFMDSV